MSDISTMIERAFGIKVAKQLYGLTFYSIPDKYLPDGVVQPKSGQWEIKIIEICPDGLRRIIRFGPVPIDGEPWDIASEQSVVITV